MKEIWKNIPGHEGYQASSLGRIKSLQRTLSFKSKHGNPVKRLQPERILKAAKNGAGYLKLTCGPGGSVFVHRLVCITFYKKPDGAYVVNHKNGNKLDNRSENLEWVTQKNNRLHSISILNKNCKYGLKKAIEVLKLSSDGWSAKDISISLGVSTSFVSKVIRNKLYRSCSYQEMAAARNLYVL